MYIQDGITVVSLLVLAMILTSLVVSGRVMFYEEYKKAFSEGYFDHEPIRWI